MSPTVGMEVSSPWHGLIVIHGQLQAGSHADVARRSAHSSISCSVSGRRGSEEE